MDRAASTGSCKSKFHSPTESFSSILFQFLGIIVDTLVQQTHYFGVLAARHHPLAPQPPNVIVCMKRPLRVLDS